MQGEREKARDQNEGSGMQPPIGNQSAEELAKAGQGSAPPRSMGTRGKEFGHAGDELEEGQQGQSGTGQADLGTQAGSTLAGHSDQQDLGPLGGEIDQPGSFAGGTSGRQAEPQGEGFIGSREQDTGDYLQGDGTPEAGFAEQGRGAPDQGDVERGGQRSQNRESDVEGSTDEGDIEGSSGTP